MKNFTVAEAAIAFARAWNSLDPSDLLKLLAPKVSFTSHSFIDELKSKEIVANYLTKQIETVKTSFAEGHNSKVYAELGTTIDPSVRDCVLMAHGDLQNITSVVLFKVENGMLNSINLCKPEQQGFNRTSVYPKKQELFNDEWINKVCNHINSWSYSVLEFKNTTGYEYLDCLSRWYKMMNGTHNSKTILRNDLTSLINTNHIGAVNELSWFVFWLSRGFNIEHIPESKTSRPDFKIIIQNSSIIFEVTTLNPAQAENTIEINFSHKNSLSRIVRKSFEDKFNQIKYGYDKAMPTILVIFNYDKWTGLGAQFKNELNISSLFDKPTTEYYSDKPLVELSAIIYLERSVSNGVPKYKRDSIAIIDNPYAKYPLTIEIKEILKTELVNSTDSWIKCEIN